MGVGVPEGPRGYQDTAVVSGESKVICGFLNGSGIGAPNLHFMQGSTVLCISDIVPASGCISMLLLEDLNFVCLTF